MPLLFVAMITKLLYTEFAYQTAFPQELKHDLHLLLHSSICTIKRSSFWEGMEDTWKGGRGHAHLSQSIPPITMHTPYHKVYSITKYRYTPYHKVYLSCYQYEMLNFDTDPHPEEGGREEGMEEGNETIGGLGTRLGGQEGERKSGWKRQSLVGAHEQVCARHVQVGGLNQLKSSRLSVHTHFGSMWAKWVVT